MTETFRFSDAEFSNRMDKLKKKMEQKNIDLALILHPLDIYYFAGIVAHAILVIPLEKDPVFLVQINEKRVREESWIADVRPSTGFSTLKEVLQELQKTLNCIGIEMDVLPVKMFQRLQKLIPDTAFEDISPDILETRLIKSEKEIEIMKKAAEISYQGFRSCMKALRPDITEFEIKNKITETQISLGAEPLLTFRAWNQFPCFGTVSSGENNYEVSGYWLNGGGKGISLDRPWGPSCKKIKPGEFICVNKGFSFHGYHVDEARTFFIGEPDARQQKCYDTIHEAMKAAVVAAKPGNYIKDIFQAAKEVVEASEFSGFFMTNALYDFEYVGHGLGLEIDEPPLVSPKTDLILKPGMTLALEPKIMIPDWDGVDLEDTVLITETGAEIITKTERNLICI